MLLKKMVMFLTFVPPKGLCKEKKFKKSEITMEVGGWVQVSLGILQSPYFKVKLMTNG